MGDKMSLRNDLKVLNDIFDELSTMLVPKEYKIKEFIAKIEDDYISEFANLIFDIYICSSVDLDKEKLISLLRKIKKYEAHLTVKAYAEFKELILYYLDKIEIIDILKEPTLLKLYTDEMYADFMRGWTLLTDKKYKADTKRLEEYEKYIEILAPFNSIRCARMATTIHLIAKDSCNYMNKYLELGIDTYLYNDQVNNAFIAILNAMELLNQEEYYQKSIALCDKYKEEIFHCTNKTIVDIVKWRYAYSIGFINGLEMKEKVLNTIETARLNLFNNGENYYFALASLDKIKYLHHIEGTIDNSFVEKLDSFCQKEKLEHVRYDLTSFLGHVEHLNSLFKLTSKQSEFIEYLKFHDDIDMISYWHENNILNIECDLPLGFASWMQISFEENITFAITIRNTMYDNDIDAYFIKCSDVIKYYKSSLIDNNLSFILKIVMNGDYITALEKVYSIYELECDIIYKLQKDTSEVEKLLKYKLEKLKEIFGY